MKNYFLALLIIAGIVTEAFSQESPTFVFPENSAWQSINEGDTLSFKLEVADTLNRSCLFGFEAESREGVTLDTLGVFQWITDYSLVDRLTAADTFSIIFEAVFDDGDKLRKEVDFVVHHVNRAPVIDELPVFYVGQGTDNQFHLGQQLQIHDPDGDPLVFYTNPLQLPQGASLAENGHFRWKPSRNQFRLIRNEPAEILFTVEDQPAKSQVTGKLIIAPTQMDLPPEIVMVPGDSVFTIKEDEILNINFYFTDPNGDDDVSEADYITNEYGLARDIFVKNSTTQYEFTWTPGYEFVEIENGTKTAEFTFFVLDKSNTRSERTITVVVEDTENLIEKDKRLYTKYRGILVETMDLIAQLDENQKKLNKNLKKAKRGQRNRAIMNASLGAITGVGPVFLEDPTKDYVTGIGGTTVLTMGTLEATDVIGRSKDDILEAMKLNIDIRNMLQTEGDQFARRYALKSRRRDAEFFRDLDKLKKQLNNKQLILLEMDGSWQNSRRPTDNNLRKTFPDFNNKGYE